MFQAGNPGLMFQMRSQVLADRAVARKIFPCAPCCDRCARPRLRVAPKCAHAFLRVDVYSDNQREEKWIMIEKVLYGLAGINAWSPRASAPLAMKIDHFAQRQHFDCK